MNEITLTLRQIKEMRSCMNCKHGEETLFENNKSCINTESEYYEEFVDDRDLCKCWEDMNDE